MRRTSRKRFIGGGLQDTVGETLFEDVTFISKAPVPLEAIISRFSSANVVGRRCHGGRRSRRTGVRSHGLGEEPKERVVDTGLAVETKPGGRETTPQSRVVFEGILPRRIPGFITRSFFSF